MKPFLIRINTLGLILTSLWAIVLTIITLIGLVCHAKPEMILVTFLGAILMPFAYALLSATISWLSGAGFKVYVSLK